MRPALCVLAVVALVSCGRSGVATMPPEDSDTSLLTRWNAAVDASKPKLDFHWLDLGDFPHPTYRGGSNEAYSEFAAVFVLFLETPGNAQFLEDNDLLDRSFLYGPADSQSSLTLRGLLKQLQSYPQVDMADQQQLQALCHELGCG